MKVYIKVWPNDSVPFDTEWQMPVDVLDERGIKDLLDSFLRAQGLTLRECIVTLSVDELVIVRVSQQRKIVRSTRMYPK